VVVADVTAGEDGDVEELEDEVELELLMKLLLELLLELACPFRELSDSVTQTRSVHPYGSGDDDVNDVKLVDVVLTDVIVGDSVEVELELELA